MQNEYRVMVQYKVQSVVIYVLAADVLAAEREALAMCPGAISAYAMQYRQWVSIADAAQRAQQQDSIAEQRRASRVDVIGHDGVQPWSAGELFPCVLARVERYEEYPPLSHFDGYRAAYGWSEEEQRRNYEGCRAEWYRGRSPESRLRSVSYELIAYGRREEYASREDAETVARWINSDAEAQRAWRGQS